MIFGSEWLLFAVPLLIVRLDWFLMGDRDLGFGDLLEA